ncbi:transposase [Pseudomonas alliivorans]|uniref:transposase n=1 Tax=Pseudomonas alliivorans TaxID=2810613 RepID=UPI001AE62D9D|nr:transposase [Pseudomonas alliivorans]
MRGVVVAGAMRQRISYPKPFKAQVVQECLKPIASVSSITISHGINANVIRKWLPIYRDKAVAPPPPRLYRCNRGLNGTLVKPYSSHCLWPSKRFTQSAVCTTSKAAESDQMMSPDTRPSARWQWLQSLPRRTVRAVLPRASEGRVGDLRVNR